jgi:hypothetical protein
MIRTQRYVGEVTDLGDPILRKFKPVYYEDNSRVAFWRFWCPACDEAHEVHFNDPRKVGFGVIIDSGRCKLRVTQYQITFDPCSAHSMAGKSVPLPNFPE